jgi:3'-phosphoadenosine 5'-phosphosulfate sulfotransferase (PAPS reductase)/FAD synthetase
MCRRFPRPIKRYPRKREEYKNKLWLLRERQNLSLDVKIKMTEERIKEYYEHWNGMVFVSFSGGKDSTVLLHIARKLYPRMPAVFVDTGLEYPEIKEFVNTIDNVMWIRPKISFYEVIKKYGYPIISKKVARYVHDLQNANDKNKATCNLRRTGFNRKGIFCKSQKLPKKYLYLVDAPFKISDKCCDIMKKRPIYFYKKLTKRHPITGMMAEESETRLKQYLDQGCNYYTSNKNNSMSMPMSFWTEKDVWDYIRKNKISYSNIYDKGFKRTGCMFCMFGVHLEKEKNRFQIMKQTHPKQYKYCIDKLGCGDVLDYIGVEY